MEKQPEARESISHPGGNPEFWRDDVVRLYDYRQSFVAEGKNEALNNISRIVSWFCKERSVIQPMVLDVGCGPGTLSTRILDGVPQSTVVGVDASDQMIEAANRNLPPRYGPRFSGLVSDFNSDAFWLREIDRKYDFIVSSGALHYLSDQRRDPFFTEAFDHLKTDRALVACIGTYSTVGELAQLGARFRAEFVHSRLEEETGPQDFDEVRTRVEQTDAEANVNWRSPQDYLEAMRSAGFKGADTVWQLWIKSIFVAIS